MLTGESNVLKSGLLDFNGFVEQDKEAVSGCIGYLPVEGGQSVSGCIGYLPVEGGQAVSGCIGYLPVEGGQAVSGCIGYLPVEGGQECKDNSVVVAYNAVAPEVLAVEALNHDTIAVGSRAVKSSATLCDNLTELNTMRGGEKGFKGYVAEPFVAHDECLSGKDTIVVNDNGPADLLTMGKNGHIYRKQVKFSASDGKVDFEKYQNQTVIVNNDRSNFKELVNKGKAARVKVVRSNVAEKDVKPVADAMQLETKITQQQNSYVIPKVVQAKEVATALHKAGMASAKTGAIFGSGFSLGKNAVKVLSGEKDMSEAVEDVAKDTVVAGAVGYGTGVVGTAIASTSAGAAVAGALSSAGAAISGTAVGGAAVGAGTAAIGAIGSAGVATVGSAVGAVGAVGGAIGSAAVTATAGTVIGGAVASGVGAATAGAAALGAAAVAAAPVVAVGAVLGGLFSLFSD